MDDIDQQHQLSYQNSTSLFANLQDTTSPRQYLQRQFKNQTSISPISRASPENEYPRRQSHDHRESAISPNGGHNILSPPQEPSNIITGQGGTTATDSLIINQLNNDLRFIGGPPPGMSITLSQSHEASLEPPLMVHPPPPEEEARTKQVNLSGSKFYSQTEELDFEISQTQLTNAEAAGQQRHMQTIQTTDEGGIRMNQFRSPDELFLQQIESIETDDNPPEYNNPKRLLLDSKSLQQPQPRIHLKHQQLVGAPQSSLPQHQQAQNNLPGARYPSTSKAGGQGTSDPRAESNSFYVREHQKWVDFNLQQIKELQSSQGSSTNRPYQPIMEELNKEFGIDQEEIDRKNEVLESQVHIKFPRLASAFNAALRFDTEVNGRASMSSQGEDLRKLKIENVDLSYPEHEQVKAEQVKKAPVNPLQLKKIEDWNRHQPREQSVNEAQIAGSVENPPEDFIYLEHGVNKSQMMHTLQSSSQMSSRDLPSQASSLHYMSKMKSSIPTTSRDAPSPLDKLNYEEPSRAVLLASKQSENPLQESGSSAMKSLYGGHPPLAHFGGMDDRKLTASQLTSSSGPRRDSPGTAGSELHNGRIEDFQRSTFSGLSVPNFYQPPQSQLQSCGPLDDRVVPPRKVFCDICNKIVTSAAGPVELNSARSSVGKTTLLCLKCQEDLLNSNRLLESQQKTFEKSDSNLQRYLQYYNTEFLYARADSVENEAPNDQKLTPYDLQGSNTNTASAAGQQEPVLPRGNTAASNDRIDGGRLLSEEAAPLKKVEFLQTNSELSDELRQEQERWGVLDKNQKMVDKIKENLDYYNKFSEFPSDSNVPPSRKSVEQNLSSNLPSQLSHQQQHADVASETDRVPRSQRLPSQGQLSAMSARVKDCEIKKEQEERAAEEELIKRTANQEANYDYLKSLSSAIQDKTKETLTKVSQDLNPATYSLGPLMQASADLAPKPELKELKIGTTESTYSSSYPASTGRKYMNSQYKLHLKAYMERQLQKQAESSYSGLSGGTISGSSFSTQYAHIFKERQARRLLGQASKLRDDYRNLNTDGI